MKHTILKLIALGMALGLALSCGPGNSGSPRGFLQGPYAGSSFIVLKAPEDTSYTTQGGSFLYTAPVTITDKLTFDVSGAFVPVPNIEVEAWVEVNSTTTSDFSFMIIYFDPTQDWELIGGGKKVIGPLNVLKTYSDNQGQVSFNVVIPQQFDGTFTIQFQTASASTSTQLKIIFKSGTSCTDGADNNKDGVLDNMDLYCKIPGVWGYGIEPTANVTALTVTQTPAGKIAVGGVVSLTTTGGMPPYYYNSSNPGIATVDSSGYVTGVSPGSAAITVMDSGGNLTTVSVNVVAVASIKISPATSTLNTSGAPNPASVQMTAVELDIAATTVVGLIPTWNSSNLACATVTGSGLVAAVLGAPGTCTVNIWASVTGPPAVSSPNSVITVNNP